MKSLEQSIADSYSLSPGEDWRHIYWMHNEEYGKEDADKSFRKGLRDDIYSFFEGNLTLALISESGYCRAYAMRMGRLMKEAS